jgi:hypothetical protein
MESEKQPASEALEKAEESKEHNILDEKIKTILDWAEEGPGQHNFLRIVSDNLSSELEALLIGLGYTVLKFTHPDNPSEKKELEELLVNAQTYMNHAENKKIAVLVTPTAYEEWKKEDVFRGNWSLNSQYLETFE